MLPSALLERPERMAAKARYRDTAGDNFNTAECVSRNDYLLQKVIFIIIKRVQDCETLKVDIDGN